ncbi:2-dehydro-3-deoxygalactonokinase [Sphingomonas suaedae]|uniref:2-dehydro-3-deoxygalactonokinase n=1 Tax=Sphingomonas suaedae TaxID=2599297 RepID=UPI0016472E90|nr:2-dehydro-3-deoxygalactonokinase [Sphingomonas suaedae]
MSLGVSGARPMVGINWGSSNFRAWRIGADGTVLDRVAMPHGVAALDREGMRACIDALVARWGPLGDCWASGMIGSNIGWADAGYCKAPSSVADLAAHSLDATIGDTPVRIIPGLACTGPHGGPDVMRGEEVELYGYLALCGARSGDQFIVLPGTHSKWVHCRDGRIVDFFTAMGGEIFDRMTSQGLLASITEGSGAVGAAFDGGCDRARLSGLGLGSLLFETRARAVRAGLGKEDAASHLRGLLIGGEIADALRLYPALAGAQVTLIGNPALSALFARPLGAHDIAAEIVDSERCCIAGYGALVAATSDRAERAA